MKTCTGCKATKNLREFRIDEFAHLGRRSECYECERVKSRERMRIKRGTKNPKIFPPAPLLLDRD